MKIKYSPCKSNRNTQIKVINNTTLSIDGEDYIFPEEFVDFPDIAEQTSGVILKAYRKDGDLWVEVLRRYSASCPWDTGDYHTLEVGDDC